MFFKQKSLQQTCAAESNYLSFLSEKRRRNCEKPPAAQHGQRHVGPRPSHSVLGVSAERPAGADHHQARRVGAVRSGRHLQGIASEVQLTGRGTSSGFSSGMLAR